MYTIFCIGLGLLIFIAGCILVYYWKKPDSFRTKFNVIIDFIFGLLLILSSVFIFSII